MLTAGGIGNEQAWNAVLQEKEVMSHRPYQIGFDETDQFPCFQIGELDLSQWFEPHILERVEEWGLLHDCDFQYLLASIHMALEDAKLNLTKESTVSIIIGHENLGMVKYVERLTEDINSAQHRENKTFIRAYDEYVDQLYQLQTFPYLFYLAHIFDIHGHNYVTNNACASGLYALELGRQLIASNTTDVAIVACSDYAHVSEHLWLQERGAMSHIGEIKPFDLERSGSVLGDGAGAIILESHAHAERRQAEPYCEYAGGSFSQDTWHMTLPDVSKHLYSKVMTDAVQRFADANIDLIVPHGTGSPMWDLYEAKEIHSVFQGQHIPDVTAFKGYTGHTLGACNMIETILLIHAMKSGIVPKTLFSNNSDPKLNLPIVTATKEKKVKTAMKAVPAFAGFQAAGIFKSCT